MASIKSQMTLNDGMSATINRITKSLQTLTGSFIAMQQASANGVNAQNFEAANAALVRQINLAEQLANEFSNVADETERTRKNIEDSTNKTEDLMGKVKKVVTTLGITAGVQKLIALSDQQANNTARLSLLVDDGGSVSEVENMIFASAMRSRSAYQDTVGAVAKLGMTAADAFSDASGKLDFKQVIGFTELLNKNFVIGGASASEQAAAMYQLTQAMASGRLQGEEYKSIIENAPLLAASIEDYMRNVAGAEGAMKDWASQGLLRADVIKAAVFSTAGDVNDAFSKIPLTWSQVWTLTQNIILKCLNPVLRFINLIANNLDIAIPVTLAAAAALSAYMLAAHGAELAEKARAAATFAATAAKILAVPVVSLLTGATMAETAAQWGLNAALYACPIVWIIALVIALIAVLFAVVAIINKITGSTISATGLIFGAISVLVALIGNLLVGALNAFLQLIWTIFCEPFVGIIEWILNACNGGFNSFVGAVGNLIGQVISWVLSLFKVVTAVIDAIFGFDWTSKLTSWQAAVTSWGKTETAISLDRSAPLVEKRFEYGFDGSGAWQAGKSFGKGIEDKIGGMFGGGDGFNYDELMGNVGAIAGNTDAMAGGLDMSNEQLEYLRDIAERDAVNRFTTAEVKIDMTGMTNKISGSADLDGVISGLTEGFAASLLTAAEGVPA